jgi:hypothetical protein
MATRVTDDEVHEIMDLDSGFDTTPHIKAANLLVTDMLASKGLSADLMKEVERWLAAHFAAMTEQTVAQEGIGDARAVYEGKTGMGLQFTRYGQQVMVLDHSGTLANLGKRVAKWETIGPSDSTV